jgi:hypothetical protein
VLLASPNLVKIIIGFSLFMKLFSGSAKHILIGIIMILWVTAIIAAYFLIHKPWGTSLDLEILTTTLDLFLTIALICLAGGLGRRITGISAEVTPLERILLRAAVGVGVLSIGVLFFGFVGLLYSWFAWAMLVLGVIVLWRYIIDWLKDFRILADSHDLTFISRLAKWFVILIVSFNLFKALAPPLKWDTLVYHLEIPKQYLNAGRIFFYSENLYAGFPQVSEMLFTWAMALRSGATAATLGWAVGVIAMIGVDGYARRLFGPRAAWLAPAILLSGFSISQAMNWAYVDLWVVLFGSVFFISLDYYKITNRRFWLIISGMVAGFAISTKYTSGMILLFGAVMLLPIWDWYVSKDKSVGEHENEIQAPAPVISADNRFDMKKVLVDCLIMGVVAGLTVLPWLIKNFLFVGNPFYPILFTGDQINPWAQTFQSGFAPERSISQDLLLPIDVTLFGIENAIVLGKPEYAASIGPLLLALIPGIFLGWRVFSSSQKYFLRRLLGVAVCTWLVWAITSHFADELMRSRHYYGIFGVLSVLATGGLLAASSLKLPQVRVGRVLNTLVALVLVLAGLTEVISFVNLNPLPVLIGQQSQAEYLEQQLGSYAIAIDAVNELPSDSVVLFLWEPRTYYCEVSCLLDGKLFNWWYLRRAGGNSNAIAEILQRKGITHILIYDAGLDLFKTLTTEYNEADWEELTYFKEKWLVPLLEIPGQYSLYQFSEDPG